MGILFILYYYVYTDGIILNPPPPAKSPPLIRSNSDQKLKIKAKAPHFYGFFEFKLIPPDKSLKSSPGGGAFSMKLSVSKN